MNGLIQTSKFIPFNPKKYGSQRAPKRNRMASITQLLQGTHKATNQAAEHAKKMYEEEVRAAREKMVTQNPWLPEFGSLEEMKHALAEEGTKNVGVVVGAFA